MAAKFADDPLLEQSGALLGDVYGDRLDRAVLFGSRARGDARAQLARKERQSQDFLAFTKTKNLQGRIEHEK